MRQEISLYLNGRNVEFNEPPQILFSYIRTDYTDPTVLRNSYSKTLNIEGTPNNNQIFNSIYHLDKISDYGTFNPAKRMEFQLFSNGDILEQGYAKLDKINKNEKNISYDITLYGGLGEFLYNLSYDQTAEGSDTSRGGGEDRRLSSLIYYDEVEPNKEFDFEITKDTVAEAWEALEKGTGDTKWKYINFAPAYNGYPQEDFDADKVLINTQNSSCPVTYNNNGATGTTKGFPTSIIQNDTTYRAYNNYAIGELSKEMTEWEMRDLRSYLQRPVLSMKGFINAIKNPANNGGYEVELDSNFFNEDNPYYEKAWFTLPLLKKDEVDTGQSAKTVADNNVLSVGSRLGEDYDVRYYLQGLQAGATYNGVDLTFSLKDTISNMPNEVYTSFADYNIGFFGRDAAYMSSIFIQLVGEDSSGNAIAASPIYNFTSRYGNEKGWWFWSDSRPPTEYCSRSEFTAQYTPDINTQDVNVFGRFVKTSGNNYVWKTDDGNLSAFTISLTDEFEYDRVYFRVTKCYHWRNHSTGTDPGNCFEEQIFSGLTNTEGKRRNILGSYANRTLDRCGFAAIGYFNSDTITATTAVTGVEVIGSQVRYTVASDIIRSGDHISKGDLLNFDGTPCDYLLSYCKLFNLYLTKDIYDRKIYIRTRDTFYNGGTIDLDKFIDRSKEIKVDPLAMESRWYDFAYPEDEMCGAAEDYDFNYGVEYGKNKVQTTYEFDSTAVDLFSENIFQNSVQVQESSKHFTLRTVWASIFSHQKKTVPTFLYDTVTYKLFSNPNDTLTSCILLPPSGYNQTGYTSEDGREDWLPKLQLNNDNQAIDGTNILCFYGGFKTSPYVGSQQAIYYLTDDLAEMYVLNGERPCWLWTKNEYNASQRIAKGMTKLPIFSRMLYDDSGEKIEYTWDFGRVRNTYVPVKNYVDKATIYERWWADYIADLYNANTRVAEVYVKMEGKVVGDWLRAMYWWDNNYWVLTEINDYNITSYDTTKCKFVRVNDIANYTSSIIPPAPVEPNAVFVPEKYIIDASGETISGYISCTSPDLAWHIEYPSYTTPSVSYGTGNTNLTFTINSNSADDGREFKVGTYILTNPGSPTSFWQEGQETKEKTLSVLSGNRFIFNYQNQSSSLPTINYKNRGTDTITITSDANWISLGTITWNGENASMPFTLTENTGTTVRSATLTISAVSQQLSTTVIIDQLPQSVVLSNNGESKTLTLRNTTYGVNAMDGFWATITTSGSDITFTAGPNIEEETRYENVKFEVQGEGFYSSASTQLIQSGGGGELIVAPSAITAEWSGGDKYIVITAVTDWNITSKPDWVNLSTDSGASGQSVVVVSFPSYSGTTARTGNIVISDGTRSATVNLTQNANTQSRITVSPSSMNFPYTGATLYASVMSPYGSWSVTSKPDWVVLTQSSGNLGYYMVGVTAPVYTGSTNRTGNVIFMENTTSASVAVQVLQTTSEVNINFSPSALTFDFYGGVTNFTVTADCGYTILKGNGAWFSVTPDTGFTGETTFTVSSQTINTGTSAWSNSISIIGPNGNAGAIAVTQPNEGSTRIAYTADTSTVAASGETRVITIDATDFINSSITVTVQGAPGATYTYDQTSTTRGTITVNIPENPSAERDVSVIVTGRRALSTTTASAVITFPQAEYAATVLNYTTDTSTVASRGEVREIIIDPTGLVNNSFGVYLISSGVTYRVNNNIIALTFPKNPSSATSNYSVTVSGLSKDGTELMAFIWYNQEGYISVEIPYTADTSPVAASGETRYIYIDRSNLIESSITVSVDGVVQSYNYRDGIITVVFPPNKRMERTAIVNISATTFYGYDAYATVIFEQETNYLTFNIISGGTIKWVLYRFNSQSSTTRTIQYKKNNDAWQSITSSTAGTSFDVDAGDVIKFKGNNILYGYSPSTWTVGDMGNFVSSHFETANGCKFNVSGDIESLFLGQTSSTIVKDASGIFYKSDVVDASGLLLPLDYSDSSTTKYRLRSLFAGCTSLIQAPVLSATTIMNMCYANMFNGCESLSIVPSLPATTLGGSCYQSMFWGCTSITSVPTNYLPATALTEFCYEFMFNGCTSLRQAPVLPTTTLARGCYEGMFYGCTSLTAAPELPATTLADDCYSNMFAGCTSLTTVPQLPALTLADYCYDDMFSVCTSLVNIPINYLPATALTEGCYLGMFRGCTSLTTAPELPAATLAENCYHTMFSGCTSLRQAPVLPATTLATSCYRGMFSGCTSLNYIKCLATDISATACTYNWDDGVAPTGIFIKNRLMEIGANGWRINDDLNPKTGIPQGWVILDDDAVLASAITFNIPTTISGNYQTSVTTAPANATVVLSYSSSNTNKATIDQNGFITAVMNGDVTFTVEDLYSGVKDSKTVTLDLPLNYQPLTFEIISDGDIVWKAGSSNQERKLEYTKDGGETWVSISSTTTGTPISVVSGDTVEFRCGDATSNFAGNYVSGSTCRFNAKGNIMSLLNKTGFPTATTIDQTNFILFKNCTGLTNASDLVLPATTIYPGCYQEMFSGCINLLTAPATLPATNLTGEGYYRSMFSGCTSLTTTPELCATTMGWECCKNMFAGCTSLTTAPALSATTLTTRCCENMFAGCTSLTTAPVLPATNLSGGTHCYQAMFSGCTSLRTAPALPATILDSYCYQYMFSGCTSLTTAPVLPATAVTGHCYEYMFAGCTSLTNAPSTLPATNLTGQSSCYAYMFSGCTSLTTAPELSATTLYDYCYEGMFSGCTSLTTAPELSATTMKAHCYRYMFAGCTSLTTAPDLPATTLSSYCYLGMFSGCTNLNYIKCLATNISASDCTKDWVNGVASAGTFVKDANMALSTWGRGANGIPTNWTVQNA